jgi:hypothetical protein
VTEERAKKMGIKRMEMEGGEVQKKRCEGVEVEPGVGI